MVSRRQGFTHPSPSSGSYNLSDPPPFFNASWASENMAQVHTPFTANHSISTLWPAMSFLNWPHFNLNYDVVFEHVFSLQNISELSLCCSSASLVFLEWPEVRHQMWFIHFSKIKGKHALPRFSKISRRESLLVFSIMPLTPATNGNYPYSHIHSVGVAPATMMVPGPLRWCAQLPFLFDLLEKNAKPYS